MTYHKKIKIIYAFKNEELEQKVNDFLKEGIWVVLSVNNGIALLAELGDY